MVLYSHFWALLTVADHLIWTFIEMFLENQQ